MDPQPGSSRCCREVGRHYRAIDGPNSRRLTNFGSNAYASSIPQSFEEKGLRFRVSMAEFDGSLIGWAVVPGSSCGHVGEFEYYGTLDRIPFELIEGAIGSQRLQRMA